jgi:hypothetical protein
MLVLQIAQDLRYAEDADCDRHEVEPVGIFADAEREAREREVAKLRRNVMIGDIFSPPLVVLVMLPMINLPS